MKKIKKILLVAAAALIGIVFIWTFVFLVKKTQKPQIFYRVVPAVKDNIEKVTVASGKIVPRREINIKAGITGIIEKIYVEPGDPVAKGTTLLKIKIVPNQINLNEARNRLEKAKIAWSNAKLEKEQNEKLLKDKLISELEYNNYAAAFEAAALDLETAENNLQLLKEGAMKKAGAVNSTLVKSTAKGTVLEIPVKEGETVVETSTMSMGTTIAVIADLNDMVFEGQIDESEVGKLHEGLKLKLTIGAIENRTFDAILEYIAPKGAQQPNDGSIQFSFRAAIKPQKEFIIRAGYSANATIILDKRENVVTLPESAILFDHNRKPYVELETGPQVFKKQDVKVGLSDGIKAEIVSGVKEGDKVKNMN